MSAPRPVGEAERFQCGKQIANYLGLVPSEESSGDRRRLGHLTKQGNSLLRFLLVEAAQVTVRSDPECLCPAIPASVQVSQPLCPGRVRNVCRKL